MAKSCDLCQRGTITGRQLSHAHNVTPRRLEANLQRVRALVEGTVRRVLVCTRCVRSGAIVKPPARNWTPEQAATK